MSPSFDDLVGTDFEPGERERLECVHDLLVAAGPPPEFEPQARVVEFPRRRRWALLAIAAAFAVAVLALGGALVQGDDDHSRGDEDSACFKACRTCDECAEGTEEGTDECSGVPVPPGGCVVLQARMDLICVVSSCPFDLPIPGWLFEKTAGH